MGGPYPAWDDHNQPQDGHIQPQMDTSSPRMAISSPRMAISSTKMDIFSPRMAISSPRWTHPAPGWVLSSPGIQEGTEQGTGDAIVAGCSVLRDQPDSAGTPSQPLAWMFPGL